MFNELPSALSLVLLFQLQYIVTVNGFLGPKISNNKNDVVPHENISIVDLPSGNDLQEYQSSDVRFKRFTEEDEDEPESPDHEGPYNSKFQSRYHQEIKKATQKAADNNANDDEENDTRIRMSITTEEEWQVENIMMHNVLRKMHRKSKQDSKDGKQQDVELQLDYRLSYHAQVMANELAHRSFEANISALRHNWSKTEGENEGSRQVGSRQDLLKLPGTFPVRNWYKEVQYHTWGKDNNYSWKSGHFTQLVWGATKRIGCARMISKETEDKPIPILVMICRYSPPGNYRYHESYEDHVHPRLKDDLETSRKKSEWNTLPDLKKIEKEIIDAVTKGKENIKKYIEGAKIVSEKATTGSEEVTTEALTDSQETTTGSQKGTTEATLDSQEVTTEANGIEEAKTGSEEGSIIATADSEEDPGSTEQDEVDDEVSQALKPPLTSQGLSQAIKPPLTPTILKSPTAI